MDSKLIYQKLNNKFSDNKYILNNSYVFDWESDFFYMTSSGYFCEIEVKTSKSDFKKDFTKVSKHRTLKGKMLGEKLLLQKTFNTFEVTYEEPVTKLVEGKRVYDEDKNTWVKIPSGKPITRTIQTSGQADKYLKDKFNIEVRQISSGIEIKKLPKCPHKFSYICPKNLIGVEEVPEYAGLYYVSDTGLIREVKRAPFIHKENLDLTKTLLDKFYYKSLNLENKLRMYEKK